MRIPNFANLSAIAKIARKALDRGTEAHYSDGRLQATEGHVAVSIAVADHDGDDEGMIPIEALDDARKMKRDTITANGAVKVEGIEREYSRDGNRFPDLSSVLQMCEDSAAKAGAFKARKGDGAKFGIDGPLLVMALDAIGAKRKATDEDTVPLQIHFDENSGRLYLRRLSAIDRTVTAQAVIMGLRIGG